MKYEAIKIVSIFIPRPLFQWLSILVWWMIKIDSNNCRYTCFLLRDTWKQMLTSWNYIKMKEISIFHEYFGTINAFIYKAYYIDFQS